MKKLVFASLIFILSTNISFCLPKEDNFNMPFGVILNQQQFTGNNISTWVLSNGVFNNDMRTNNTPGFEWPRTSGKFAIFTTGH